TGSQAPKRAPESSTSVRTAYFARPAAPSDYRVPTAVTSPEFLVALVARRVIEGSKEVSPTPEPWPRHSCAVSHRGGSASLFPTFIDPSSCQSLRNAYAIST